MEISYYIPIISDYGFKATFGNETDSLFLRTALQALIKSNVPIQKIEFDKNAFEALTVDSRSGIFDVSCTDEQGNQFIVVELAKFDKPINDIATDLDKLVYTMKTLHTTESNQYPAFWNEEWLKRAINELDTRKMTPEERAHFARITAANAEAVKAEKKRIEDIKVSAIQKALQTGKLTIEEIADINDVSMEFVINVQQRLTQFPSLENQQIDLT